MAQRAKYYAIDVEAVATGTDHNARSVAQISVVDEYMRVLLVRAARGPAVALTCTEARGWASTAARVGQQALHVPGCYYY